MKNMKNNSIILAVALLLSSAVPSSTWAQSGQGIISFDHFNDYANGYVPTWVEAGVPIKFKVRSRIVNGEAVVQMRGLFDIYSPDGAAWQPIEGVWNPEIDWGYYLSGGIFFYYKSNDGQGADTVMFNSFHSHPIPRLGPGFSEIAWIISTQVDTSQIGKTICIDKVSYIPLPVGHAWLWGLASGAGYLPEWGGEKCFTIVGSCCQSQRGDINGDGNDANTLDLNSLINYKFRSGPPPPCMLEADLNGDGNPANTLDLTYLINYKYRGGPAPVGCP